MDSQQTFSLLLERLDYDTSPNLFLNDSTDKSVPAELEVKWKEIKEKLQVDAVYFVANTPIIYFKRFESYNENLIAEFHRNIWNQSQTPLIFVILPDDIRVYNGYEAPQRSPLSGLIEPHRLDYELSDTRKLWERLEIFTRIAIESGSFWRDHGYYFRRDTRADQKLIANLRYVRRQLITEGKLSPEHAHSLIGRSIFAFYLQDRGVLPVGDDGYFASTFGKSFTRYTDLLNSYEHTYEFFDLLRERFDGDMFPVTQEEKRVVTPTHLNILYRLFTVDNIGGGQLLFFWAYDFAFIPIELISSIYEEFLYQEESGKDGAYYTPLMLVDFVLDQVLPWGSINYKLRILDPACGSGIFLVEAYRRLVEQWRKEHTNRISFLELVEILTSSIFGIDIKRQALRVAAFSLYLALLDYLEPKSIWAEVTFPSLIGINLIESDFFQENINIENHSFDLVVGNPPWESQLTFLAQAFLRKNNYVVGDNQIAQAFLWRAPELCSNQGQIALLCSSKSLLHNRSGPNVIFRKSFFESFTIKKIFDFSAIRRFLFEKGIAPAAAIFYTKQRPSHSATVFYGAPKPTHLTRRFAAIVIESNDLKQIPMWQIFDSINSMQKRTRSDVTKQKTFFDGDDEELFKHSINIWKPALWGTNHDYTLLQALDKYPSLNEVIKDQEWKGPHGGFNLTGPDELKRFEWLDYAKYLDAKDFTPYGIDSSRLESLPPERHYYRGGDPELFKAPFVLFKRGQVKRRPGAAFSHLDFAYSTSMTGIAGPEKDSILLKALTALFNSDFAQYFWFLTSSSWGVEREEITVGELWNLPFPFLEVDEGLLLAIANLVDELARLVEERNSYKEVDWFDPYGSEYSPTLDDMFDTIDKTTRNLEQKLNRYIYQCFQFDEQDIQLIQQTVEYTINFFNSPEKSIALLRPTIEMQRMYAEAFVYSLNFYLEPVNRKLTAIIYEDDSLPLLGVQFTSRRFEDEASNIQVTRFTEIMRRTLPNLHKLSIEQPSKGLFHKRNFRIYDNPETLSIFKAAERRLWTVSAALSDAEETLNVLIQPKKVLR